MIVKNRVCKHSSIKYEASAFCGKNKCFFFKMKTASLRLTLYDHSLSCVQQSHMVSLLMLIPDKF